MMNISTYLDRINHRGPLNADAETLRQLHVAHLRSVPFENLSIHAHEPISLDDESLFEKIVTRRRGGFCYELNGLFAALLRALGFQVTMLSAEVANDDGTFSKPFDHMTLMVNLEDRWLADVGFGDSFIEPLRIDERGAQIQGDRAYRIEPGGDYVVMQQKTNEVDGWKSQYRFNLTTYQYADYLDRCLYHQTSPASHFTQNRICSMLTTNGRISVSDKRFIVTTDGVRNDYPVGSDEEYRALLLEHFGVVM
ncbi:MAG TPA: arylamine N-acetyltransferase [Pyrinomonadaceae bacterium]|nr:arylamine N-acetyltransferase [Pyrinomonadaceae bacterium]